MNTAGKNHGINRFLYFGSCCLLLLHEPRSTPAAELRPEIKQLELFLTDKQIRTLDTEDYLTGLRKINAFSPMDLVRLIECSTNTTAWQRAVMILPTVATSFGPEKTEELRLYIEAYYNSTDHLRQPLWSGAPFLKTYLQIERKENIVLLFNRDMARIRCYELMQVLEWMTQKDVAPFLESKRPAFVTRVVAQVKHDIHSNCGDPTLAHVSFWMSKSPFSRPAFAPAVMDAMFVRLEEPGLGDPKAAVWVSGKLFSANPELKPLFLERLAGVLKTNRDNQAIWLLDEIQQTEFLTVAEKQSLAAKATERSEPQRQFWQLVQSREQNSRAIETMLTNAWHTESHLAWLKRQSMGK